MTEIERIKSTLGEGLGDQFIVEILGVIGRFTEATQYNAVEITDYLINVATAFRADYSKRYTTPDTPGVPSGSPPDLPFDRSIRKEQKERANRANRANRAKWRRSGR